MSEIKLKPCPFCGCKNIQFWEADNDTHRFQIVCMQCFNGTDECITKEVAIERWNIRKPIANIVEKLEEKQHQANKDMQISELYEDVQAYGGKYLAFSEAINIVKQEINNGLE